MINPVFDPVPPTNHRTITMMPCDAMLRGCTGLSMRPSSRRALDRAAAGRRPESMTPRGDEIRKLPAH